MNNKYLYIFIGLFFLFNSCEKEQEIALNQTCFSNRPTSGSVLNFTGELVFKEGEHFLYVEKELTHYYACNLPVEYRREGKVYAFSGLVKSKLIMDPLTGNQVEDSPVECGKGLSCALLVLTEIEEAYKSDPIW